MFSTRNRPAAGPFTRAETATITIPVLAASLLHSTNMSTAYVALPAMQGNLSATPDQIGWVVTAFIVASALGTTVSGWLAVKFGRRLVFLWSIAAFTVTAMLCASADSLEELVLFRALQGFGSAPLLPISQAIMLDTYPRSRHGFAMSIWSMGMILGPVAGPTVGALLTEFYGWRYVFFINVPLGCIAFLGIWMTTPETEKRGISLDWIGLVTLAIGVACLQLVLDRGERQDWFSSPEIIAEAVIAGLCLYLFVAHSLTARSPYIDLAIFRDRNFAVGLALIFVFGVTVFASMFLLPLFLQNIQGYPVLAAGWVLSARGIGTGIAMFLAGVLANRVAGKYLILAGLAAVGISNVWMTGWNHQVEAAEIVWATVLNGAGMGLMWVSLTTVTFSTLAQRYRTEGAALFALIRSIGASMGTSIVVAVLTRSAQANYTALKDFISDYSEALSLSPWDIGNDAAVAALRREVLLQAETIAFVNDFALLAVTIGVAAPLVLLLRKPGRGAGE